MLSHIDSIGSHTTLGLPRTAGRLTQVSDLRFKLAHQSTKVFQLIALSLFGHRGLSFLTVKLDAVFVQKIVDVIEHALDLEYRANDRVKYAFVVFFGDLDIGI